MATPITVKGKQQTRPGVYTEIKSGIQNPALAFPYGNIVIIDTGLANDFAAGSGINGSLSQGQNSIFEFDNIIDFRNFVKGGYLWLLAEPLFKPDGNRSDGVSKIYYIKAATTQHAEIPFNVANGNFTFQTLDEGTGANGVLTVGNLSKGYGVKLIRGVQDTSKFVVQFYVGTFKGLDAMNSNVPYDGVPAAISVPRLVCQSVEVSGVAELLQWCSTSNDFITNFKVKAGSISTPSATGTITVNGASTNVITAKADGVSIGSFTSTGSSLAANATGLAANITSLVATNGGYTATAVGPVLTVVGPDGDSVGVVLTFTVTGTFAATGSTFTDTFTTTDLTTYTGFNLATGGTETYNSTDFDDVLPEIKELDNFFFLSTEYGVNATSMNNTKLQDFVENETKVQKYVAIGGGYDSNTFKGTATTNSEGMVKYFNSDSIIIVHGGVKKTVRGAIGFRVYDQLYKTAVELGRVVGLPPQVPVTLKPIAIDGEVHPLNEKDQEFCLKNGILYSYYDTELAGFVSGQGINSLQNNTFLVNEDGTSFSMAVKRITSQLNYEILYTAKRRFFGSNNGPNRATITPDDIKAWLETFLKSKMATSLEDNLIIRFGNINVTVNQDNYFVSYEFVPNFEVSKIIFTGFILDK